MMHLHRGNDPLRELKPVLEPEDILQMQEEASHIAMSEDVENYLLHIVHASRQHEYVENGVSPRGTLALMRAAQARAYLHDRDYVTPDDVKVLVPYLLAHRLVLTMEGEMRTTKRQCVLNILETVEVPVEAGANE